MDAKSVAKHVIDTLPNNISMNDIIHALYVATKFEKGEDEIRSGKGVSDTDARSRLKNGKNNMDTICIG